MPSSVRLLGVSVRLRRLLRRVGTLREGRRFEALQRYGADRARRVGVEDESDVTRLINESRS